MHRIPLLLLGLLNMCAAQVFAAPLPNLTLTASMEQPVCREGQPVVLALALRNESKERFIVGGSAFEEASFQITVTDKTGRSVPRTSLGERVLTPPMAVFANSTIILAPDQTLRYRFNLARLFDLSRSGTYRVDVSRSLRPQILPPEVSVILPPTTKTAPVTTPPALQTAPQEFTLTVKPLIVLLTGNTAATSGPTALVPPPSRQTFLYIVGRHDGAVTRYLIGSDGSLSFSMADSSFGSSIVPKGCDSLVATPDGHFLYVGNGSTHTVSQFRIGDNGVLFPLFLPTVTSHSIPGTLLMDPKGHFLYNLSGSVYAIGSDGRLTVTVSVANDPPGKIQYSDRGNVVASYSGILDPKGNFLYSGAITGGYHLTSDGIITAPPPPSETPWPASGNVNAIALSPSGKFAFVGVSTNNSSGGFDRVVPRRVGSDGTLSPIPGAALTPQSPPLPSPGYQPFVCTGLAVDPTGHFLIVVNPGFLDCYRIQPDGSLTFLSMTLQAGEMTSIFFGPVGHFVYAMNRNTCRLTPFRLDDKYGLTPSGVNVPNSVPFDACMTSAVAPTPQKWGATVGGLIISAHLDADVLPVDAPVVLTVSLKNVTKQPINLGRVGADMAAFRLSLVGPQRPSPGVLRDAGKPWTTAVPLLAAGRDLLDAPYPSSVFLVLPPGATRQYRFVISRLADVTEAGQYSAQITRLMPNGTVAAAPMVPFMLDGSSDNIIYDRKYSVQIL